MKSFKLMVVILLSLTITTAQSQGVDDPLLINNLEDLNAFRDAVNLTTTSYQGVSSTTGFEGVYFKITADIDMSSINNWEPIGTPIFCFYGNLDGDNHVISNIRIVYPTMDAIGFFRYCMAGSVENLHFEGGTIQGSNEVGTICGNAMYTQFNNCSSTANVIGTDEVGQLLGRAFDCAVSNCTNLHDISGNEDVGGICGSGSSTSFQSCVNRGNVSGTVNVGGICGNHSMFQNMGNIVNCKNYGNIDVQEDMYGNSEGGGIIGRGSQSILNNCINFGNVFGTGYSVGGMAGRLTGTCENCINMGRIQGGESVYGIANEADAYRCINGGPIIGEGFRTAGITNSNIAYACVNTGDIYGSYDVGGIISSNLSESNHYYDCINAGNVFGSGEDVGAICGLLSFMGYNVENCYWDKQMCNTLYGIGHQESSEGTEPRLTTELTGFALQSAFNAADWVFTEGLYPYPAGFNNPEIARLAVSPIFLHHSITDFEKSQLILSDFDLTIVDNNQWTSVANKVAISGNHATLIGTGYDTLCVSNNEGITKQIPVIVNPLGTILNPLTIDNEQDLCDLSQAVNNFTSGSYKGVLNKNDGYKNTYFALTADLDMKSYEMAPIGIFNFPFRGNFNGKNHTINNLTIHQSGTHVALFGALEYGVIDSLNMMNVDISGESWVASIAGYADESMIRNCHAFGNIHGNNNFTGGICGQIYEESTIFHCTFGGVVDGFRYAGGITAGSNDSWIKRCI
ncbi:MAG: hypothetical protein PHR53_09560, partial [Bacteroidales bacterium]|nr:hypothetical protein [Bacteroidales bacterium]